MIDLEKIGFGGGCHWCTEAVFQAVKGVIKVDQGYIASEAPYDSFSEGVIVHFDPNAVSLLKLIAIHIHTHAATREHSFREKYRSAIYCYNDAQESAFAKAYTTLQKDFKEKIVTKALSLVDFKMSRISIQNYFQKHPEAPFCKRYIIPKLSSIHKQFPDLMKQS